MNLENKMQQVVDVGGEEIINEGFFFGSIGFRKFLIGSLNDQIIQKRTVKFNIKLPHRSPNQ